MPDPAPRERRLPCLLDRLTDTEARAPGGVAGDTRDRRVISVAEYRRAVVRDLAWLLNCGAKMDEELAAEFPHVATSVLNYGVPDLCGLTASGVDPTKLQRTLQRALEAFEPRVRRRSLKVQATRDPSSMSVNAVTFEIKGELWAQPVPERLLLKTEVDLETGDFRVEDKSNG